jgi:uncharacterized protein involved in exopolysaccharide biosynthesis
VTQKTYTSYPEQLDDQPIKISALLNVLWRKKVWIGVCICVSLILGAFYAYTIAVPKYRSTSVILLDPAGQQVVDLNAILPSLGAESEAINTEVEIPRSRKLLERVVLTANLTQDPEFNGALRPEPLKSRIKNFITGHQRRAPNEKQQVTAATNALLARLSIRNIPNTYVLQITAVTQSAEKSARLADTVAEQYILYQMDVKFDATRTASEWLTSRVADLKIELETAEAKVAEFSSSAAAISATTVQALDRQLKD